MAIGAGISQRQNVGMVPEHILGKAVLKMNLPELRQYLQTQFAENPALALEDYTECPACSSLLIDGVCTMCGSHEALDDDHSQDENDDWEEDSWQPAEAQDESYAEPFASVATPRSLTEYLKEQIGADFREEDRPLAEFIVDSLGEDGYLREPMIDIASQFGLSVPEAEVVLTAIQKLDPPGVAARSLQECLLIQISLLDVDSADRRNAEILIREHWDPVSRMKIDETARNMNLSRSEVESALRFIRRSLNPYPAGLFRDPWQEFAPRRVSKVAPDVVVHCAEAGTEAVVMDPVSGRVAVEDAYAGLYAEMSSKDSILNQSDRAHVREYVTKARAIIEALEFRHSTLRRVTDEILRCQAEFFVDGPTSLKPMTRKELAQRLEVHESTVCRALQDKTIRLPSGDAISFDVLFDSALPVKELVRRFAAERLTDGEIAKKLEENGIQIARRTVAKYRDQLRVLPLEYRFAG